MSFDTLSKYVHTLVMVSTTSTPWSSGCFMHCKYGVWYCCRPNTPPIRQAAGTWKYPLGSKEKHLYTNHLFSWVPAVCFRGCNARDFGGSIAQDMGSPIQSIRRRRQTLTPMTSSELLKPYLVGAPPSNCCNPLLVNKSRGKWSSIAHENPSLKDSPAMVVSLNTGIYIYTLAHSSAPQEAGWMEIYHFIYKKTANKIKALRKLLIWRTIITKNFRYRGTEPYKAILGAGFPLHKQLIQVSTSILGTWNVWWNHLICS